MPSNVRDTLRMLVALDYEPDAWRCQGDVVELLSQVRPRCVRKQEAAVDIE